MVLEKGQLITAGQNAVLSPGKRTPACDTFAKCQSIARNASEEIIAAVRVWVPSSSRQGNEIDVSLTIHSLSLSIDNDGGMIVDGDWLQERIGWQSVKLISIPPAHDSTPESRTRSLEPGILNRMGKCKP
jgi:hypothetical protein